MFTVPPHKLCFVLWHQVQLAPKATVIQALQVSQEPLDFMGLKANVVVQASLAGLGCATHPCATVAWWGRIPTAKGQIIDAVELHCKQPSGAHVEQAILRKIALLLLFLVLFIKVAKWFTAKPSSLVINLSVRQLVWEFLVQNIPTASKWSAHDLLTVIEHKDTQKPL